VFKFAVNQMAASTRNALARAKLTTADIDFVVPHQANLRIVDATIKMLGVPPEKCIVNIAEYGNTSSASIPIALAEALEKGLIKNDQVIVLVAFGGGLSWGSVVWRWKQARVVRAQCRGHRHPARVEQEPEAEGRLRRLRGRLCCPRRLDGRQRMAGTADTRAPRRPVRPRVARIRGLVDVQQCRERADVGSLRAHQLKGRSLRRTESHLPLTSLNPLGEKIA